jgi:hypothetical protein
MTTDSSPDQILEWVDDELVDEIEEVPDASAEYNYAIEMSGLVIHIIKRDPEGSIQVGQEIEFDDKIRSRIQEMAEPRRDELVAQIRETLMETPILYGFQDIHGENVRFGEMDRIFLERRLYGDIDQQALMDALIGVWKSLRYLDDIWRLIESVENAPA